MEPPSMDLKNLVDERNSRVRTGDGDSQGNENEGEDTARRSAQSKLAITITKQEQDRLRIFRCMLLVVLAMTAAVTAAAFVFLGRQENHNFETAVSYILCFMLSYVVLWKSKFKKTNRSDHFLMGLPRSCLT